MNIVWSHGTLESFETCPREFWHGYVIKDLPREAKSDAQKHGIYVHDAFDVRLRAKRPLPEDLAKHEPLMQAVERAAEGKNLETEKRLAITADGSPCDFFAKDVWMRSAADVVIHKDNAAFIPDWKTGKKRDGDTNELRRLALLLKCTYPGLEQVKGAYFWLQTNEMGNIHDLSNFAATFGEIKAVDRTVQMMDPTKEWPANKGWKCRGWCRVKTCEFNESP